MSFSTEVKEELSGQIGHAKHCRAAELGAMLSVTGEIRYIEDYRVLLIKTENPVCYQKLCRLLKLVMNLEVSEEEKSSETGNDVYRIEIQQDDVIHHIFQTLKLSEADGRLLTDPILAERSCCKRAFLRGIFIAGGSINNPEKAYHMEIVLDSEEKARQLLDIFGSFGIDAKYMIRKKYHVVYIKEGAVIVDVLNIMEAHISLMKMENIRIVKDLRNSINRQVNCDAANMNKTANAAVKQMEDISYIAERKGLDYLPENLKEVAELRQREPELSLKDLGMLLDPPLGKSGVNHRLRKISELADDLRKSDMRES
jgi:hypothetical protein